MVGAHLLFELATAGEDIRAIHRKSSDLQKVKKVFSYYTSAENAEELFSSIEWQVSDITNIPALTEAFKEVRKVYHCAALVDMGANMEKAMRKVNIKGTANVVNLCIANKIEKLCYVSSIASLGRPLNGDIVSESSLWNPEEDHSDYAISKYGAEIEVWRGSQEGLQIVMVNPGVIIGPGFWNSGSGSAFSRIDKGLNYHFPKVTGFVGIKDVVQAMQTLMESDIRNEKFILVSENLSFTEFFSLTADSIKRPRPNKLLKKWMINLGWFFQKIGSLFGSKQQFSSNSAEALYERTYFSSEKIKNELSFNFTPITEVIAETGNFYRQDNSTKE